MLWLPDSVNAFRKMALLRVAPRSPRTFAFYEMAPGIMWAVLFHTPTNDLHLSKLAVGQDKDEWNHLKRMSEAVSTYIGDLQETRRALLDRLGKRAARAELSDEAREADREANRRGKKAAREEQNDDAREAAREANKRQMKAARAEQNDEAREAAREADRRGKKAARAEQSDEAKKAAREEERRRKEEARKKARELQKATYAEEEAAAAAEREREFDEAYAEALAARVSDAKGLGDHERDPEASLRLFHEVSGAVMFYELEQVPDDRATDEERARWREKAKGLIKDHVAVSPEDLLAIQERFREVLSPNKPLPACASCGTRCMAARGAYKRFMVVDLPEPFRFTEKQRADLEAMGTVDLVREVSGGHSRVPVGGTGEAGEADAEDDPMVAPAVETYPVRLRDMVSCFVDSDGRIYHLHADLVEHVCSEAAAAFEGGDEMEVEGAGGEVEAAAEGAEGAGGATRMVATVRLCHTCAAHASGERAGLPSQSLAAGVDYGRMDCLQLPPLTDIEKLLLSDVRMYANVLKVVAPSTAGKKEWQHVQLRAHFITFLHQGRDAFTSYVGKALSAEQRVSDFLDTVRAPCTTPKVPLRFSSAAGAARP
jgi:hypothetical protein